MKFEAFTIENVPLIQKGDDIAQIICDRTEIFDNDIVVIASTIVAKSEGAFINLDCITPSTEAINFSKNNRHSPQFIQAVLDRSKECLIFSPMLLVEMKNGHICINAGIDESNVEDENLLDMPKNSDISAQLIGEKIEQLTNTKISVIITDTNGRAFKIGQTGIAVGVYHLHPIKDWKGKKDLFGKELKITEESIADEIAAAANLLMGEGDGGYPIVVIRGFNLRSKKQTSIKEMYRPDEQDIIKKSLRYFKDKNY